MIKDSIPDDQQEDLEDLALEENWYFGATLWSTESARQEKHKSIAQISKTERMER